MYDPFLLCVNEAPRCLPCISGGLSAVAWVSATATGAGAGGGIVVGGGAAGGREEDALGRPTCGRGGFAVEILDEEGDADAA